MPADDRAPSIQYYPRDWMADPAVQALSWDERGRFHWAWSSSLLTDRPGIAAEDQWRRWMGYSEDEWPAHREAHRACFRVRRDGVWVQARTVAEREAQKNRREKSRKGAATTNDKRWGKVGERRLDESLRVSPASASASALESTHDPIGTLCLNAAPSPNGNGHPTPGPTAACLARCKKRFTNLDLPVIEMKMLAAHAIHPYKSLDRAMVGWCKKADENGWDAKPATPRITPDEWVRRKEAGESF